jgi:cell division transport system ATP-binding protein
MIKFESVTKAYDPINPALRDIDLMIETGEFVFLIGASGSGKSTFMSLILREIRPTTGSIFIDGVAVENLKDRQVPKVRRAIGAVFQDFKLLPNRTVAQNVGFANRFPHQLSGGEQQRVAIARACVNQPTVLIADEPTGNLDPDTSLEIMKILDRINRSGTTILVATHDAAIVDSMRRRVIELENGSIVRDQERGIYWVGN